MVGGVLRKPSAISRKPGVGGHSWALALWVICVLFACTSERKATRTEVREPTAVASEVKVVQPPSTLRQSASVLPLQNGCGRAMVKHVRSLALRRWPKAGCPQAFAAYVQSVIEESKLNSEDRAILDTLKRIDCQGQSLLSNMDGADSLADSVKSLLDRERGVLAPSSSREVATASDLHGLGESLQKILSLNVPLEKKISSDGEYLLSEDNLQFILRLSRDNCQMRSGQQFFDRDSAMLVAMESNESLIVDASIRRDYSELRKSLQKVFDQNIRSFF